MTSTTTFKYLVISDVHIGAVRCGTQNILRNLDLFFDYFNKYRDLNAIFIAGDFFDSLLDNHTEEYHNTVTWIYRLLNFCSNNKIKLRVLEGTPSHDWGQCKIFQTLHSISKLPVDFKYIDRVYIEHLEDFDVNVLYVPDEANETADITYNQIQDNLKELNIPTVDIAIMHGMFAYQMKHIVTNQTHDAQKYLDMVKYYIHIGHIHTHSKYERIIAQGSFDRLSHGEEEDKGAVIAQVDTRTGGSTYTFVPNTNAKIFKTINVPKSYTLEEVLERLDKVILKLPIDSHVRIKAAKDHVVYQAFEELRKRYIEYNLSKKSDDDVTDDNKLIDDITPVENIYECITITSENITELIVSNIANHDLDTIKLYQICQSVQQQTN